MKLTIISAISITLLVLVLAVGWLMPEYYTLQGTDSHMLGLKFMSPCTPLFGNATCGYDLFMLLFIICVFGIVMRDYVIHNSGANNDPLH